MGFKESIFNVLPQFAQKEITKLSIRNMRKQLNDSKKLEFNTENLRPSQDVKLEDIFNNDEILTSWQDWQEKVKSSKLPDFTGGANPGDRRALFYLIRHFKPASILEIGTHIGASTVNIASAISYNQAESKVKPTFRTVDIRDVNSTEDKPWLQYGSTSSPIELLRTLKLDQHVEFTTDTSINFFENTTETYDFIFLDGDHAAKTVYQEVSMALTKLNKGGIILLHDFFPDEKPLWSNNIVIHGPFLAGERFRKEGVELSILPLGSLPWATKLNSNVTSLALCLKK